MSDVLQTALPQNQQAAPATPQKTGGVGAMVGTIIIVVLFLFGALYFWGEYLNARNTSEPLPLIPGDPSSVQL